MQAKEKRQGEGASVLIIIRIVVRRAKRSSAATPPSREFLSCSAPRTRAPLRWCQARKTGLGRDATIARILILFGAADTRPFALVSGAQNGARPRRHHRANSYLVRRRGHAPLCAGVRRAKRGSAATPPSREFLSCSAPRTRAPLRWCQARKTGLGRDATIARILILFGAADTRPFALVSGAQNGARPRRHHRANSYLVWR